jgi:hypothetical protein
LEPGKYSAAENSSHMSDPDTAPPEGAISFAASPVKGRGLYQPVVSALLWLFVLKMNSFCFL